MVKTHWPVKLFWLPFSSPAVFSLGVITSSFLLEKRRRMPRTGCYVAVDNEPPPPRRSPALAVRQGDSGPTEDKTDTGSEPKGCQNLGRLKKKAKAVVRFLELDRSLKRAHALSSRISCGQLRSAVRHCFSDQDLGEADELSIKTACKVERRICDYCNKDFDDKLKKWKEARFADISVDDHHLSLFVSQFLRNVPVGWNQGYVWPYVPNGHATAYHDRSEGGNWNVEPLDSRPAVGLAFTAGKERVVTSYSSTYSQILYPLHRSLYATLRRKGWLLLGQPTEKKVASLNGRGEMISVDYRQATDNIKTAYTKAAVEALIQRAEGLSTDEVWALREFGVLKLEGKPVNRGQPMGSLFSFPVLCLINKTVVDLALNDLLEDGEISFKEWTSHRCLINGDDLLLKSPTHQGGLTFLPRLIWHGGQVGLVVNEEKTMVSSTGLAEMNSTLFKDGILEKKTNAGIFRGGDVSDVLGLANEATTSVDGFLHAVNAMVSKLRLQVNKAPARPLPNTRWRALLREARVNPRLKDALTTVVREEPFGNAFPVTVEPPGYDLSAEEEKVCIERRVQELRNQGYKGEGACGLHSTKFFTNYALRVGLHARKIVQGNTSLRKALSRKKTIRQTTTLKVLADEWQNKQKRRLVVEDDASVDLLGMEHVCDECAGLSAIARISCEIKAFKQKKSDGAVRKGHVSPGAVEQLRWRMEDHREEVVRVD